MSRRPIQRKMYGEHDDGDDDDDGDNDDGDDDDDNDDDFAARVRRPVKT